MDFLARIAECVQLHNYDSLANLMEENQSTPVSPQEFESFTQLFATEEKCWLKGCVNIHGMGGSGVPKANLTSIACLYLSAITDLPIAKTGSRKNTGIMGSTDFFEELGYLAIQNRKQILEDTGFTYFDYLELSPWKAYKPLLRTNPYIADILNKYHFFEYEIGTLGLGISSKSIYDKLICQNLYPAPKCYFTFFSEINGKLLDEVIPQSCAFLCTQPLARKDVSKINLALVNGTEQDSYWHKALRESVSLFAYELGEVTSLAEGRDRFDKAYADKVVANMLKRIL